MVKSHEICRKNARVVQYCTFSLPGAPGGVLLHHGLALGHQLLAGLAQPHLVLGDELV